MIGIYILLAVSIALGIGAIVVGVLALRKKTENGGVTMQDVRAENDRLKAELNTNIQTSAAMTSGRLDIQSKNTQELSQKVDNFALYTQQNLNALNDKTQQSLNALSDKTQQSLNTLSERTQKSVSDLKLYVAESLQAVQKNNADSLQAVQKTTSASLDAVRADNQKQLEKMRETVDEKLSSTLKSRFDESFVIVNKRLEELGRSVVELQSLQSGVNDLNKIFKNVKTRGTWGEVALESLLSQILTEEQYSKQVQLKRGSEDRVDFAIKMPGKGDGEVLLPIDAKFPLEDYARLVEASEAGDVKAVEAASKALAARVKQEAKSIRDKYIVTPKTTDFAILYLPTEGLYAEIVRNYGLIEELQNSFRIIVCGPTTITALLNSLQMGFRSVAVEKRSTEISKLLIGFNKDFEKFAQLLKKTGEKLGSVKSTIDDAEFRTQQIRKKLDKVTQISGGEEEQLLDVAADFGEDTAEEGGDDET